MNKNSFTALIFTILAIQVVLCQESSFDESLITARGVLIYSKWRQQNARVYQTEEERIYRQIVFLENEQRVSKHNTSGAVFSQSLNQFSDMTSEEFVQRVLNSKLSKTSKTNLQSENFSSSAPQPNHSTGLKGAIGASSSFDWRNYGAVGGVKNQGQCGSCWTFATAGVLESLYFIKYRQLPSFSEQDIVDCASPAQRYQSNGCNGGFPSEGLYYASVSGVVQSSVYPYVASQGKCRNVNSSRFYLRDQYYQVPQDSASLQYAISRAPVSVAVDASTWQFYNGGVYNGCGSTQRNQLNHAVIAVGYDSMGSWIVRNSWGTGWGQGGYITLAAGNTCGILYDNYAFNI